MNARAVIFVAIAIVAIIAIAFTFIARSPNNQQVAVEVTIPQGAFIPPQDWKDGYVFDDKYYAPNTISISVGQTVRWINNDSSPHTVTSHKLPSGAKAFDSGPIGPGKEFVLTFAIPGEYEYHCDLHPYAAAKILVAD